LRRFDHAVSDLLGVAGESLVSTQEDPEDVETAAGIILSGEAT